MANCGATGHEGAGGRGETTGCPAARTGGSGGGDAKANKAEVGTPETAVSADDEEVSLPDGVVGEISNEEKKASWYGNSSARRRSDKVTGQQTCIPTAEEEGLPLPAAMTLRFLAAMDEGYVGSRREENARLRRRRNEERAG